MTTDSNLQFIREKIYALRSAIMYSMSTELVKLPNNVVTAIKVDDEGQLWFLSKRPLQLVSECAQVFPARLKFYRKGIEYSMEVSGQAEIVNPVVNLSSPEYDTERMNTTSQKPVLVRMSMLNIEYVEPTQRKKNWMDLVIANSYKWISRNLALPRHSKSFMGKLHQSHI